MGRNNMQIALKSGNEAAAYAARQINYHVMGYYPITPSTQIAENIDLMVSEGKMNTVLIAAEGEHSAAGICYGASVGGGRVLNATSANGLLYALEQLPVQSGTRMPMVMNVACRTVSGPLSIKGDHSDIMFALNCGWIILFANNSQQVYDFNLIAPVLGERVRLPVIVAYDGFFTSHQRQTIKVLEDSEAKNFVGEYNPEATALDVDKPITIGSYMNEPDLINNKYQLHLAMTEARSVLMELFEKYGKLSGRKYSSAESYKCEDAEVILFILGSSFDTATEAVDRLRAKNKMVGVLCLHSLRPLCKNEIYACVKNARVIIAADRQDSYGANGGNMSTEIKALLKDFNCNAKVITRIYGLGGLELYVEDVERLLEEGFDETAEGFEYCGIYKGKDKNNCEDKQYFKAVTDKNTPRYISTAEKGNEVIVNGANLKNSTLMPRRMQAGHGACPGCGIPINVNLLLKGIEGNVVLLFHTGCGMVVSTAYPKTAFTVNYVHNLFQNGAATLSGLAEMCRERIRRGELPDRDITFVMVSGDGGLDIGLGCALGTALRGHRLIIFEYDNGGYMNTGYQLSYSTPMGAKSSTSHVGEFESGKSYIHKDNQQIFAATGIPYVATCAESNPLDFIKKAAKAQYYAKNYGPAYIKAISACPLNWNDNPRHERDVIDAAVKCCYHPLYEVERGITKISFNPELKNEKIPVGDWFKMMGRTKHLTLDKYKDILDSVQAEVDLRWERLKAREGSEIL
jgi:pyruvate ferredoxin oxidoreductase alpha subunit